MGRDVSGRGRVTVFDVLHDWQTDAHTVIAYTSMGHFGDTAVLGVIPVEGNEAEPGDLFALAGRHNPGTLYGAPPEHARGAFLACLGYSARTVRKPSSLDLVDVAWSLTMTQSVTLGKPMYGHLKVMAGRMTLEDDELMERARRVLGRAPQQAI
ncbi:hypothetical protein ACFWW5_00450 [Streptomyces albidoflavus]